MKINPVEETRLGVYVWEMPDGKWVGDDQGNYLSVQAFKNDQKKIAMLSEVVKGYGILEGKAVFLSGRRKINDEEYEYQKQRLAWGLVPDELDIGVFKEDNKRVSGR